MLLCQQVGWWWARDWEKIQLTPKSYCWPCDIMLNNRTGGQFAKVCRWEGAGWASVSGWWEIAFAKNHLFCFVFSFINLLYLNPRVFSFLPFWVCAPSHHRRLSCLLGFNTQGWKSSKALKSSKTLFYCIHTFHCVNWTGTFRIKEEVLEEKKVTEKKVGIWKQGKQK